MNGASLIKVFLIDSHAVLRVGIKTILEMEEDITVVGESDCGSGALEKLELSQPDVVILDAQSLLTEPELVAQVLSRPNAPGVLLLTEGCSRESILDSFRAGALGCCSKTASMTNLRLAVRIVHTRAYFLDASSGEVVLQRGERDAGYDRICPLQQLSRREEQVLDLLVHGANNSEIAAKLGISLSTVKSHMRKILGVVGAKDRTTAVLKALALRNGEGAGVV